MNIPPPPDQQAYRNSGDAKPFFNRSGAASETEEPMYAIAPINADGITKGKKYAISKENEISFSIRDDAGDELFCLKKGCAHLDGGNWQLTEA